MVAEKNIESIGGRGMIKEILLGLTITVAPDVTFHKNVLPIVADLREVYHKNVHITSNYRTKEENKRVKGLPNSKHLCGKALDIRIWGMTRRDIANILRLQGRKYEIEIESDHVHIETKEDC